jgi:hypothetical protein
MQTHTVDPAATSVIRIGVPHNNHLIFPNREYDSIPHQQASRRNFVLQVVTDVRQDPHIALFVCVEKAPNAMIRRISLRLENHMQKKRRGGACHDQFITNLLCPRQTKQCKQQYSVRKICKEISSVFAN